MEQKTFPAFGFYVIRNKIAVGEVINDSDFFDGVFTAGSYFSTVWVYSEGLIKNVEINTGVENLRGAGYNNIETPEPIGTWRALVLEPTVVFCLPPVGANAVTPSLNKQLTYFHLPQGESRVLPQGTKLSLFAGELQVGTVVVPELRQVELRNGARTVVANKECYGVIVP